MKTPDLLAELDRRMNELNQQWDLNDYTDHQEPQNVGQANAVYCELKRIADRLQ